MNIGLLHRAVPSMGGAYQYSENVIRCLQKYDDINNYVLFYTQGNFPYHHYEGKKWKAIFLKDYEEKEKGLRENFRKFLKIFPFRYSPKFASGKYHEIRNYDIDLLFCLTPSLAGYYSRIRYVITVFDLMDKYYSEFPEISFLSRKIRNMYYERAISRANLVIADSARGKEDIINFYGIPEEKIEVFPSIPISSVEEISVNQNFIQSVRSKYNLPKEYIFYPAQLWYHKNHIGIVKALHLLKMRDNIRLTAVFTGSRKNAFNDIMRTTKKLQMKEQIMYLGYVPDEEIRALYKGAISLVMPTFFGPANIPIWEAFALGCPVITSDVYGIPEQVDDAGLLVDPRSIEDIADKICRLYIDKNLREKLSRKGLSRVKYPGLEHYTKKLIAALNKAGRA